jgi:hypothetical protein
MILIIFCAGALAFASARAVASGYGLAALVVITPAIALPLWITCDRFLLQGLPTVWWFDAAEPFAPYFLLYLPLSVLLAIPPAAALIIITRRLRPNRPSPSPDTRSTETVSHEISA